MKRLAITLLVAAIAISACSRRAPVDIPTKADDPVAAPASNASDTTATAGGRSTGPSSFSASKCGTYAIVAYQNDIYNRGIKVVNVTQPTHPALSGSLVTDGEATRAEIRGNVLCFGNHFCDIRDPQHPVLRSFLDTLYPDAISLQGSKAYLGCEHRKVVTVDFSDPARPIVLGSYLLPNSTWGIAVKGRYAYVADHWAGLRVVDVVDPANPHEVADLLNMEGVAESIEIDGHYAYVTQQSKVSIVDISHPLQPVKVAEYAGVTDAVYGICVHQGYLYVTDRYNGIQIVDVHDPAHPQMIGELVLPGRSMAVAVEGDVAYVVGDNNAGLRIIDIKDKAHPSLVASLLTGDEIYDIVLYRPGSVYSIDQ